MKPTLKKVIRKVTPFIFLNPEGKKGIEKIGHRKYVGDKWDRLGNLQFDFLIAQGLTPESFLLDIACGSLRLGVKAIPYLEPLHYLGIEKESELVKLGLEQELGDTLRAERQPNIVISNSFEFEKLGQKADFAIAQSLFSHLPSSLINLCFEKLYPCLKDNGVFYATYFETSEKIDNPKKSHDHGGFFYTQGEMLDFGTRHGFSTNYIGNWNHPRNQVMVEYKKN